VEEYKRQKEEEFKAYESKAGVRPPFLLGLTPRAALFILFKVAVSHRCRDGLQAQDH
jgi:hypothetical protein